MIKVKKRGSILIKNLFSISIIFILCFSIANLQSIRIRSTRDVVRIYDALYKMDIIKNELYFNKQYLYMFEDTYLDYESINLGSYKEFNELFENKYDNNSNYFHLEFDEFSDEIHIEYVENGEVLLNDELII